jgi:hypothetical protein
MHTHELTIGTGEWVEVNQENDPVTDQENEEINEMKNGLVDGQLEDLINSLGRNCDLSFDDALSLIINRAVIMKAYDDTNTGGLE